jgi:anti-sigma factor RsiW
MTQQCKYDEQLLDYVYGELSETEARRFAEHLQGCSACAAQVASYGRIRTEFKNRPPVEPAGESLQRMTALLMQAAAESAATASPAAAGGGGKLLQFRSRGVRRFLLNPAGGVMAVAAAALFWVVFRAQPGSQSGISSPTAFTAVQEAPSRPAGSAAAPEPAAVATAAPGEKNAEDPSATVTLGGEASKLEQRLRGGLVATGKGGKDDKRDSPAGGDGQDFDGLRARSRPEPGTFAQPSREEEKPPAVPQDKRREVAQLVPPAAKPATGSAPDSAGSALPKSKVAARAGDQLESQSAGPTVVALADQAYGKKKSANFEAEQAPARPAEQFAQPPPPPQAAPAPAAPASPPAREPAQDEEDSVRGAIARTQEQRKQKVVEALANQELGSLGAGAGAPTAQSDEGRYAQRAAPSSAPSKAEAPANGLGHPLAASEPLVPAATVPGGNNLTRGRDDSASPLAAVKDQLRRGQCAEANAALTRLERSSPELPGLADTRAEWQSSCANPLLERRLANDASEAAAPAPARASKLQYRSPSPAKSPPRKAAKPERSNAKAVDSIR